MTGMRMILITMMVLTDITLDLHNYTTSPHLFFLSIFLCFLCHQTSLFRFSSNIYCTFLRFLRRPRASSLYLSSSVHQEVQKIVAANFVSRFQRQETSCHCPLNYTLFPAQFIVRTAKNIYTYREFVFSFITPTSCMFKKKWSSSLSHMCHPYAGAMLIFSVFFQFRHLTAGEPTVI